MELPVYKYRNHFNMNKKTESPSKKSLYNEEEQIYQEAINILNDEKHKNNPLLADYSILLDGYKRILKRLQRVVRLGDLQQSGFITELEYALESFIRTLVTTIEAKHKLTAGHTQRVTEYSLYFGRCLNLPNDKLNTLKYASLLHDIGKIGIPDAIIKKSGKLTVEEREIMEEHPLWTLRILEGIRLPHTLKNVPWIAACHHEKIDGSGYPHGLKKETIPFLSRILAVADVFDTLTSYRDYPKYDKDEELGTDPMEIDRVFSILEADKDIHFDTEVIDVVLNNKNELEELSRIIHKRQGQGI